MKKYGRFNREIHDPPHSKNEAVTALSEIEPPREAPVGFSF
jgi:hypothetical protein